MVISSCQHSDYRTNGKDRHGNQRFRCKLCGKTWVEVAPVKPLGEMRIPVETAKQALRLLLEGMSVRSVERITRLHRDTVCKLIVYFGTACQRFMDSQMRGLTLSHLEFDEQWTYVAKKQSRLTIDERAERHDVGDIYLWTCIDKRTKLMPSFLIGKRRADNARRFMLDVASRLVFPNPHAADNHAYKAGSYQTIIQLSTDGFAAYPEAVDLAFGPYVRYGTIIKEYKNANMIYTPSEMVGTKSHWHPQHRQPQRPHDNDFARGTSERHPAFVYEAAQSVDAVLLKETGKLGSGLRHVRLLLQLLLADSQAGQQWPEAPDGGYDGGRDGSAMDV